MKKITIKYHRTFVKQFNKLPPKIQNIAIKKEQVFKKDPFHPSLRTHQLSGKMKQIYSFSITYEYRIMFYFTDSKQDSVVYFKIGTHEIYN